jgi:hypothetical protein
MEDVDCRVSCSDGQCKLPEQDPGIPEEERDALIKSIIMSLLTPDGISQMVAEELLEASPKGFKYAWAARQALKRALEKRAARTGARVMSSAQAAATKQAVSKSLRTMATSAARNGVTKLSSSLGGRLMTSWGGMLYFAIQALGVVLDIDDSAGFNAQIPQHGVDLYMKKLNQSINEMQELVSVGIQFPREYLPHDTIQYRASMEGDVAQARRDELEHQYLARLDVNSNGVNILRKFGPPTSQQADEEGGSAKNKTLWALAGSNQRVYAGLKQWWWLMVVCVCVILLTTGLGLTATRRSKPHKLK